MVGFINKLILLKQNIKAICIYEHEEHGDDEKDSGGSDIVRSFGAFRSPHVKLS